MSAAAVSEEGVLSHSFCDGLDENGLHRSVCVNAWSPVGRMFQEDYEVWPSWRKFATGSWL